MAWTKGQSGNPGGRKGIPKAIRARLEKALPIAISEIIRLMQTSDDDNVRLKAANIIIERQLGKPVQPLGNDEGDKPFLIKVI